jgi:non-specific serine/threonine protein kinase
MSEGLRKPAIALPAPHELEKMASNVPPMTGAEYLTAEILATLWRATDIAFDAELAQSNLTVQNFLKSRNPAWNLVGRVHFNLAENRKDEEAPFAFLATYTTRLSAQATAQHLPLAKALQEYAGAKNRERLLSLLMPVQRATESCAWLKAMVDGGTIFQPLRWSPLQALQFLKDIPALESAGVIIRMPAQWRMNRPARPQVKATIGGKAPSQLGMSALLDFKMEVTLEGEVLSANEIKRLLAQSEGLALIRGKWVEIDHDRLRRTLEQFETTARRASDEGLSFGEAMRMLAGAGLERDGPAAASDAAWSQTVAGPWLAQTLAELRRPETASGKDPGRSLKGTLRPYQRTGVQWLYLLVRLRLGACLADDMGLGKTIQVLCLLLVLKTEATGALYQQAVSELGRSLEEVEGIRRRGLVLAFLMRFKQICNHPSQWLGDGAWDEEGSGKFGRLRDIAEVIAARQEKALIFTQFRETTRRWQHFSAPYSDDRELFCMVRPRSGTERTWSNAFRPTTAARFLCCR